MQIVVRKSEKNTLKGKNLLLSVVENKMLNDGFSLKEFRIWRYLYLNSVNQKICISRLTLAKTLMIPFTSMSLSINKLKKKDYLKVSKRKTNTNKYISSKIIVTLPVSLICELEKTKQLNYLTKEFML